MYSYHLYLFNVDKVDIRLHNVYISLWYGTVLRSHVTDL